MAGADDLGSLEPVQRLVLLAVVEQEARGETPVRSFEVRRLCEERIGECDHAIGGVTRKQVVGALSELAVAGALSEQRNPESPTGKGRPSYELAIPIEDVLESFEDDEYVAPLIEQVADIQAGR